MNKILILTILAISLVLTGCVKQTGKNASDETIDIQLANPASVYCEEQGGELEMRTEEAGVYGVCKFSDGSECDEWAFFRNECEPGSLKSKVESQKDEISVIKGNDKIKVFNIEDNQTVFSPLTIIGQGVAFENNLIIELRNKDHATMVKEFTTIKSNEVGEIGDYSITLDFEFDNTKEGFIAVYEQSAKDGSELNLVEIPVKFGSLDISNWQTYKNEEYGYEFQYPKGWFLDKNRLSPQEIDSYDIGSDNAPIHFGIYSNDKNVFLNTDNIISFGNIDYQIKNSERKNIDSISSVEGVKFYKYDLMDYGRYEGGSAGNVFLYVSSEVVKNDIKIFYVFEWQEFPSGRTVSLNNKEDFLNIISTLKFTSLASSSRRAK